MRPLWPEWHHILSRINGAQHLLLLTDYDGTLTPIVSRPELALLPPPMKELLTRLTAKRSYTVAVISGRALEDVRALVGIKGLYYAGNHGLEIEGPSFTWVHPQVDLALPLLEDLSRQLSARLGEISGAIVENKGLTLSVHYRMVAPDQVDQVRAIFDDIVQPWQQQERIRVTRGKMVYEVRPPVDWDKGKAVDYFLERSQEVQGTQNVLPFYLGDDITDEAAFQAVQDRGGVSIFVGRGDHESRATYSVASTQEVQRFLTSLLEMGQEPGDVLSGM
ncbi:MAG: trehalose-phosphatase [Dehalococcoidia bacterium]